MIHLLFLLLSAHSLPFLNDYFASSPRENGPLDLVLDTTVAVDHLIHVADRVARIRGVDNPSILPVPDPQRRDSLFLVTNSTLDMGRLQLFRPKNPVIATITETSYLKISDVTFTGFTSRGSLFFIQGGSLDISAIHYSGSKVISSVARSTSTAKMTVSDVSLSDLRVRSFLSLFGGYSTTLSNILLSNITSVPVSHNQIKLGEEEEEEEEEEEYDPSYPPYYPYPDQHDEGYDDHGGDMMDFSTIDCSSSEIISMLREELSTDTATATTFCKAMKEYDFTSLCAMDAVKKSDFFGDEFSDMCEMLGCHTSQDFVKIISETSTCVLSNSVFSHSDAIFYPTLVPSFQADHFVSQNNTFLHSVQSRKMNAAVTSQICMLGDASFTSDTFDSTANFEGVGVLSLATYITFDKCTFNNLPRCAICMADYNSINTIFAEQYSDVVEAKGQTTRQSSRLRSKNQQGSPFSGTTGILVCTECTFTQCGASQSGSAIMAICQVYVSKCNFKECGSTTSIGGGICLYATTSSWILNTNFTSCVAMRGGAAALIAKADILVSHCLFKECSARTEGGAAYLSLPEAVSLKALWPSLSIFSFDEGEYDPGQYGPEDSCSPNAAYVQYLAQSTGLDSDQAAAFCSLQQAYPLSCNDEVTLNYFKTIFNFDEKTHAQSVCNAMTGNAEDMCTNWKTYGLDTAKATSVFYLYELCSEGDYGEITYDDGYCSNDDVLKEIISTFGVTKDVASTLCSALDLDREEMCSAIQNIESDSSQGPTNFTLLKLSCTSSPEDCTANSDLVKMIMSVQSVPQELAVSLCRQLFEDDADIEDDDEPDIDSLAGAFECFEETSTTVGAAFEDNCNTNTLSELLGITKQEASTLCSSLDPNSEEPPCDLLQETSFGNTKYSAYLEASLYLACDDSCAKDSPAVQALIKTKCATSDTAVPLCNIMHRSEPNARSNLMKLPLNASSIKKLHRTNQRSSVSKSPLPKLLPAIHNKTRSTPSLTLHGKHLRPFQARMPRQSVRSNADDASFTIQTCAFENNQVSNKQGVVDVAVASQVVEATSTPTESQGQETKTPSVKVTVESCYTTTQGSRAITSSVKLTSSSGTTTSSAMTYNKNPTNEVNLNQEVGVKKPSRGSTRTPSGTTPEPDDNATTIIVVIVVVVVVVIAAIVIGFIAYCMCQKKKNNKSDSKSDDTEMEEEEEVGKAPPQY